jgi:alkylation response protein AidB-like acyl-CoA dehydrogenase|tara:strand:- start:1261 stop:2502 length:1242 start_codon:yes stop_codon:yes gene_type:complete
LIGSNVEHTGTGYYPCHQLKHQQVNGMGFREDTRTWLEENCPQSMRRQGPVPSGGITVTNAQPDAREWLTRMAERGWTVPTWPKEYGGGGLSADEYRILAQEMRRINAREPISGHGTTMIGPAVLEFGTEEQCLEYLPPIASGEIKWCQGYSEPGAGSDLANVQMRAVVDGDDYIINGSKLWTSGASEADWIFCLVRTDPDASKHEGISFIVFDMKSPGISITQIDLISGPSDFCQTFCDDVRVPRRHLISKPGNGWTVGKRLLQYERTSIGGASGGHQKVTTIDEHARNYIGVADGKIRDPSYRDRVLRVSMDDAAYQLTVRRTAEEATTSKAPTFMSSFFKLYGTEQNKLRTELLVSLMGTQGFGWTGDQFTPGELGATRGWLRTKANTIEGGTSEVMLNIIAKRILGLPD